MFGGCGALNTYDISLTYILPTEQKKLPEIFKRLYSILFYLYYYFENQAQYEIIAYCFYNITSLKLDDHY